MKSPELNSDENRKTIASIRLVTKRDLRDAVDELVKKGGKLRISGEGNIFTITLPDDHLHIYKIKPSFFSFGVGIPIPPVAAEQIVSVLIPANRLEEALGDLDEGFALMLKRHGLVHARRWYWCQVIKVVGRGLFDVACKAAKIWSGFGPS